MRTQFPIAAATLAAGLLAAPMLAFAQPAGTATTPMPSAMPGSTAATSVMPHALPTSASPNERASKIIGANVYSDRGESIGEIEDVLLVTPSGGSFAVISVGGFLGIGSRLVVVPLSDVRFTASNERWTLAGATKESLQARPAFAYERSRT